MSRWLPVVLLLASAVAAAEANWLIKASKAVRTTDYRGTFVYLRDGRMDTIRIVHRYRNGNVRARLMALSGNRREILRRNGRVTCVLPERELVLVAQDSRGNPLSRILGIKDEHLKQYYRIRELGKKRQAGRMCRAIAIQPRDKFRYGYRLLIDTKTHVPLKFQLVYQGEVLQQLMFTTISYPESIPDSALDSSFPVDSFRRVRPRPVDISSVGVDTSWKVTALPPGFELAAAGVRRIGESVVARQLLFTDGIATVSAFIVRLAGKHRFSGGTTMGAVNAFGRQVAGHQITVVGEVPRITVRRIAQHIRNIKTQAASSR